MSQHPLAFSSLDFSQTPFLVIWEVTQACPLVCRHCRAEAQPDADPEELTLDEGRDLLTQIKAMGTPVCVLSGGDPLRRLDLAELVRHGSQLGLRMATIPVASEELTRAQLAALKAAGLAQIAFSLDGSTAQLHDDFRQVPGTFARTMQAIDWVHELGLPLQINTTFAQHNYADIDRLIALIKSLDIVFWEVFSLVPVGRGSVLAPLTARQHEALFAKLHTLTGEVNFIIKLTEAPHYRRFVLQQRQGQARAASGAAASGSAVPAQLSRELSVAESLGARAKGINAGKGFCFVSHVGEVFPSGFLPLSVGNVRQQPLADLYRNSDLMQQLRDPSRLGGRCRPCPYADVCGGSRARAHAVHGDYLAEDPACEYQP